MVIQYRKTGSFHENRGEACQDAVYTAQNESGMVIVLADGATGCAEGETGARIASQTAGEYLLRCGQSLTAFPPDKAAFLLLEEVRSQLTLTANEEKKPLSDYGSTLIACYIPKNTETAALYTLGDDECYLIGGGNVNRATPPRNYEGCPLTVTRDAHKALRVAYPEIQKNRSVFLCSDGVLRACRDTMFKNDLLQTLQQENFEKVEAILAKGNTEDDCSFIAYSMDA
jgi:serine/threonine protein phosphatase PrpC